MRNIRFIFKRELSSYFATPVAYVFIVIFLVSIMLFTFRIGRLYESNQAELGGAFFRWHPWLYLFLIPAIAMRLWAEERKSGSIELLATLPVTLWEMVLGKFFAAWAFIAIALMLTFPVWITVNYLGDPDNGVVFTAYLGSFFMAGSYLAIGSCMSAITKNQVIAFVITVMICFGFLVVGEPFLISGLQGLLSQGIIDAISSLSFSTHFGAISKGVVDFRDVLYFGLMIGFWLYATKVVLQITKDN